MATVQVFISTRSQLGPLRPGKDGANQVAQLIQAVAEGSIDGTIVAGADDTLISAGNDSIWGAAVGLLTLSGGAGALTVTMGGTQVGAATFATSDNNTALLLATSIATTSPLASAHVSLANLTVGAGVTDGETVTVNGITFTRKGSSPSATNREFANAAGLAQAVNWSPALANKVRAVDNGGTGVYFCNLRPASDSPLLTLQSTGANITVVNRNPTAANVIMVFSRTQGAVSNLQTLGVTGTGLAITKAIGYGNGNPVSFNGTAANTSVLT